MDDDLELRHFSGHCRLFPLQRFVMFPHAVTPLHIFEPRYRQMTEDALADDKLVTMVQLISSKTGPVRGLGTPPIDEVGCLGRIIQHEKLPDGCYNFLLLGRKRVRLKREIPSAKLYRMAEVEILEDVVGDEPEELRRAELTALFRRAFERQQPLDPDLVSILESALPLAVLTDIVGHALGLPAEIKQILLAETRVDRRVSCLQGVLRQILSGVPETDGDGRPFPPAFSTN
jgi:Lon protease-like protein